jgi:ppGpp synthetase/RelA/SpoT-type nucleotidyltranferase
MIYNQETILCEISTHAIKMLSMITHIETWTKRIKKPISICKKQSKNFSFLLLIYNNKTTDFFIRFHAKHELNH